MARLAVWPKRWILLLCAAAAVVIATHFQLTRIQGVLLLAVPLFGIDALLRQLGVRELKRFDHEMMKLLQGGEADKLAALYGERRLMRWFSPRHEVMSRLGLIYRKTEKADEAVVAYREAFDDAPNRERPLLAQKLADALYAVRSFDEAERYYRASQSEQRVNPGVRARLSRLVLARGGDADEAERLMREAVDAAHGAKGCAALRVQLVQLLCERDKLDDAQWQLDLAEEEVAAGDGDDETLAPARQALARAQASDAEAQASDAEAQASDAEAQASDAAGSASSANDDGPAQPASES